MTEEELVTQFLQNYNNLMLNQAVERDNMINETAYRLLQEFDVDVEKGWEILENLIETKIKDLSE